jgi:hypothetical protein
MKSNLALLSYDPFPEDVKARVRIRHEDWNVSVALAVIDMLQKVIIVIALVALVVMICLSATAHQRFDAAKVPQPHQNGHQRAPLIV